ncbi:MAG: DUF2975 domain-containing protein [Pseudomonadota bacterium]
MNQTGTADIPAQVKKVKRASAVIQVLLQIGMAFTGIGVVLGLLATIFAGSVRLDIGEGDFKVRAYREEAAATAPQLQIVPHRNDSRRDGVLYQQQTTPEQEVSASVDITPTLRAVLIAMVFLNSAVVLHLLERLVRLFHLYEKGEVFTHAVVRSIRNAGVALLLFPAVALLNGAVGSVLAATLAPQLDFFTLSFKMHLVFAGLLLIMVSWIMDVGRQLNEENALTI